MNPLPDPFRPSPPMNPDALQAHAQPLIIIARAAVDARGHWSCRTSPVALILDQASGKVLSITPASDLPPELCRSDIPTIERTDAVLLPGLINAHTHLDLTDIGPRPHDPALGFMPWIDMVRRERPETDAAIAAAVRRGISLSLAGGTVAVGDIAGAPRATPSTLPFQTLAESPIASVSYLEFFAIGNGLQRGKEAITAALASSSSPSPHARLGLQPHAPNTVALTGYEHALALAASPRNIPLCTHLAESPEEREFIARARGPQREFLESLGLWNDTLAAEVGRGLSPIEHLAPVLESARRQRTPFTAVHCNDVSDSDLDILARCGTRVVYCPRASDYFAAPSHFGPHRYREMLARGIPVALGTDSIINLPAHAADPQTGSISILDEMRHLHRRDATEPATLLAMATLHGASALDASPADCRLSPGSMPLAIIAVDVSRPQSSSNADDPLSWVLSAESSPSWLWTRKNTV
ncbi:MAG: amidohydrolase family protein [Phycisphaeraceae bacterium]|nr:amidohydrolase family protein [Phycisphaeraceae bacterium]